jgi:transposase-like protein
MFISYCTYSGNAFLDSKLRCTFQGKQTKGEIKMGRKSFTSEFKAKVALVAIRQERTINEIASEHGVHPNQVSDWKREAISWLKETFSIKRGRKKADEAATIEALYGRIGQLTMEMDWLKKKSGLSL